MYKKINSDQKINQIYYKSNNIFKNNIFFNKIFNKIQIDNINNRTGCLYYSGQNVYDLIPNIFSISDSLLNIKVKECNILQYNNAFVVFVIDVNDDLYYFGKIKYIDAVQNDEFIWKEQIINNCQLLISNFKCKKILPVYYAHQQNNLQDRDKIYLYLLSTDNQLYTKELLYNSNLSLLYNNVKDFIIYKDNVVFINCNDNLLYGIDNSIGFVKKIYGNNNHLYVLNNNNNIYSCGTNNNGELGLPQSELEIESITPINNNIYFNHFAVGYNYCIGIDKNNNLYASGQNDCGQFGALSVNNFNGISYLYNIGNNIIKLFSFYKTTLLIDKFYGCYACGHNVNKIFPNSSNNIYSFSKLGNFNNIVNVSGCEKTLIFIGK